MVKKPSLGLACIMKNEEENLPRLIASVKDCVDVIHITDTGSVDKSVDVAKSLGANVHFFDWVDDFAAARNFSFSKCDTDYTLWLDLDDVLAGQEQFKLWRDTSMHLADYWIATYNYSFDGKGIPACSFARERVIKNGLDMAWRYPIHEGIIASPTRPVKMNYTPAWLVNHLRTEEDLKKDRSRNINIFEKIKKTSKFDPRMQYYYGKELFEIGKPFEACTVLLNAVAEPALELHDRTLGIQYCCYAHMQCNQFERAVQLAHEGLQLAPQRAEFQNIIADCYLKMNQPQNAVPYYEAARNSQMQQGNGFASALFHNKESYNIYPLNQLSRIWVNLGSFDKAEVLAKEACDKFGTDESKAIYNEIVKVKELSDYSKAKDCEDIVFTSPPVTAYEWDGDLYKTKAMGGSETAAIEMAEWLHKLSGRPVKVFNMRQEPKTVNGVEYLPVAKVTEYMHDFKPFLHIAWRHNYKVTSAPTYLWCHDLITQGGENFINYEKILCLTPFHKNFVMTSQGIPEDKILVTRNGLTPEKFRRDIPWPAKDPWKFVFSSSPDRGLDRCMRVLDKVRATYPLIKLHVYYGIEHLHKYGQAKLADELKLMMEERKDWVVYHGATQQNVLMEEFKSAAYCVQPSDFIETSMISALERLCCGVYQVIRNIGGASDTLKTANEQRMATLVDSECITELEYSVYVEATIKAIQEEAYKRIDVSAENYSWKTVAEEWLEVLPKRDKLG